MEEILSSLEKNYAGVGKEYYTFDKAEVLNWLILDNSNRQRQIYFNSTFTQLLNNETKPKDYEQTLIDNNIESIIRDELTEMYNDYLLENSQKRIETKLDLDFAKIPVLLSLFVIIINHSNLDPSIKSFFAAENLIPIILFYSTEFAGELSANFQNITIEKNRQNKLQKVLSKH